VGARGRALLTRGSRAFLPFRNRRTLRVFTEYRFSNTTPMDCRRFRQQHAFYVDDTLSGVDMRAMRAHADGCAACTRHDTRLRRALMVGGTHDGRTLARIPSSLTARLASERIAGSHLFDNAPRRGRRVFAARRGRDAATGAGVTALVARRAAPPIEVTMAPCRGAPALRRSRCARGHVATISSSLPVYPRS